MTLDTTAPARKPRIALMGEFSAGKSTLSNLLLGARPLPERVTATRLSPVWISQGEPSVLREQLDGTQTPVDMDEISDIPIEDTRVIRLFLEAEMLDHCDLIDCPGISDPNMPSEVWERLVPEIDAVLWCTHATQAWRQSENSVWESLPEAMRRNSVLLVTRFDKLTTERDRSRVLARVEREAGDKFSTIIPISLTGALAAGDDEEKWVASGAQALGDQLITMIEAINSGPRQTAQGDLAALSDTETEAAPNASEAVTPLRVPGAPEQAVEPAPAPVQPRRVAIDERARTERPRRARPDAATAAQAAAAVLRDGGKPPSSGPSLSDLRSAFSDN